MPEFVRDNAGKAFEFMVEKVDEDRKAAGLGTIAEMFAGEIRRCRAKFCGSMQPHTRAVPPLSVAICQG